MYRLAIFDFDGTLVDSAPGIVDVMIEVAREYGFPQEKVDLWKQLIGVPLLRQVQILFPEEKAEFHEEVAQRYRDVYDTKTIEICPPFPGLIELLEGLKDRDVLITIASSKRRPLIETVLVHHDLTDYFSLVVGAQEVTQHKPHPESVHLTADRMGIHLADTVVIGDSTFDLDMARNAGCDAIGVTTGIHTKELLSNSDPKHIVEGLHDVLPLILDKTRPRFHK